MHATHLCFIPASPYEKSTSDDSLHFYNFLKRMVFVMLGKQRLPMSGNLEQLPFDARSSIVKKLHKRPRKTMFNIIIKDNKTCSLFQKDQEDHIRILHRRPKKKTLGTSRVNLDRFGQ